MLQLYNNFNDVNDNNKWGEIYFNQFSRGYIVSSQGPRKFMEDSWVISVSNSIIIYGIFDGHSGDYISKRLPKLFKTVLLKQIDEIRHDKKKIISVINNFFIDIDKIFYNKWQNDKFNQDGSTACIIICIDNDIYFINLGDSRSLFFNKNKIIFSSHDHKPNKTIEKTRIINAKHTVINRSGIYRINGSLAVSRSFGDFIYKLSDKNNYDGITSAVSVIPNITVINVEDRTKPRYIVLASDGLWDVFTNKEIQKFITGSLAKGITTKKILSDLIKLAYLRNSHDNISIILIYI